MRFTRRQLLALLSAGGTTVGWRPLRAATPERPLFEEVPAKASGILWVHDNAKSPERFLPETLPPGCAIFDYDNDGWMDIFLVNTGESDFFKPKKPLRNALYKNNRDGTFTDVTEQAGVAGGKTFGMGGAGGRYGNHRFPAPFFTAHSRPPPHPHKCDG